LRHVSQQDSAFFSARHSSGGFLGARKAVDNFVGNFVAIRHTELLDAHQKRFPSSRKKFFFENHIVVETGPDASDDFGLLTGCAGNCA
jgi:hypothetical protein